MTLRQPCEHGRYETHPLPDAEPTALLGLAGKAFADEDWCDGWSVLRKCVHGNYDPHPVWPREWCAGAVLDDEGSQ